ncbi:MAG: VWA domain-containing protein [Bacteroides sp.]|nr:VWA domain-containing protein [Bacteroides sp.]MCM1379798.1 VWA domain-containing protein [Bacteroides sp.]MCM1446157.1 VWA domain-containing protein [Prevotella sp.]
MSVQFMHPHALWLLLLLVPLIAWYVVRRHKEPSLGVSTTAALTSVSGGWKAWLRHLLFALRCAAMACLIVVIARPQTHDSWNKTNVEGTDIVLVLDISGSMQAADMAKVNRLEVAKKVATQFVNGRQNDNMGLVVFAGESFSAVPLTSDRAMLANYIGGVKVGLISADGTAIGDGIASAINRIKDGQAVSKSIILITDGTNNAGVVAPETAAEIAKDLGVKIYTIGVGADTAGEAVPYKDENGNTIGLYMTTPIDDSSLRQIAGMTGGKYFAASSATALSEVFEEIDALEKTEFDVRNFSHTEDNYMMWAWLAFGFFALQLLLKLTVTRSIP